jgi:small GTP-binding protein
MSSDYEYVSKILILGDAGVGKSSLVVRYCDDIFNDTYYNTIGVDFKIKMKKINNKIIKLNIWDTAGQEKFRALITSYYRNIDIIIFIFDLTNQQSFRNIEYWYEEIKQSLKPFNKLYLVGTKNDNKNNIFIENDYIIELSKKYNMKYFDTSSKKNYNINNLFDDIFNEIYDISINKEKNDEKQNLLSLNESNKNGKCGNCY